MSFVSVLVNKKEVRPGSTLELSDPFTIEFRKTYGGNVNTHIHGLRMLRNENSRTDTHVVIPGECVIPLDILSRDEVYTVKFEHWTKTGSSWFTFMVRKL